MATEAHGDNYLELFDVGKKQQVGKLPLASLKFLPRAGERVFFPSTDPGSWISYTVAAVEYFVGFNLATGEPATPSTGGSGRITLYVEQNKTD
jgi:hypothetical protein